MFARNRWLLDKLLSVEAPKSSSRLFNMEIHRSILIVTTSGHDSIAINYPRKSNYTLGNTIAKILPKIATTDRAPTAPERLITLQFNIWCRDAPLPLHDIRHLRHFQSRLFMQIFHLIWRKINYFQIQFHIRSSVELNLSMQTLRSMRLSRNTSETSVRFEMQLQRVVTRVSWLHEL
jgi:hypothetical protein